MTGPRLQIERALKFLVGEQQRDGGFLSYSSSDPHDFGDAITYRTNFFPALILSALQDVADDRSAEVREGVAKYLLRQKNPKMWSWNYWALDSAESSNRPVPDDFDDTACALIALWQQDSASINDAACADVMRLLEANQTEQGGLYRTWIATGSQGTTRRDADLAVNSNVAHWLSLQGEQAAEIYCFIENSIRTGRIGSPYYPCAQPIFYFIARFCRQPGGLMSSWWQAERRDRSPWNNVLSASMAVSSQLRLGNPVGSVQEEVDFILASQMPDGSWPASAFCIDPVLNGRTHYSGAATLTTALCLESLALYIEQTRQGLGSAVCASGPAVRRRVAAGGFGSRAGLSWRSIADIIKMSLRYLDRHLSPSGRFDYIYDGASDRRSEEYNLVRHAGTMMILSRIAGTRFDDGSVARAVDRAISYMNRFVGEIESDGCRRSCVIEEDGVAKLGATALMLLALIYKVERSAVKDAADLRLVNNLAHHLTWQQAEDGRFVSKYEFATQRGIESWSPYFPGEATLALCCAYRVTGNALFLERAGRGARYLLREQRGPASADPPPVNHWLMMSLDVLHSIDGDSTWVDHLRDLASSMLRDPVEGRPRSWLRIGSTCEIATRVEGLVAAAMVERRVGERGRVKVLLKEIFSGIARCLERQVGRRTSRLHPGAEGGFVQTSLSQNLIRIDYVQHVLAASFGALELLGSRSVGLTK